ncbi:hypothetical protein AHAS_Ahas01G0109300 [Arachis hypogaea]
MFYICSVSTAGSALEHIKRTHEAVNKKESKHISVVVSLISNASNSNEQHGMEINSARVAVEEDVAKNSKDLFEQFDENRILIFLCSFSIWKGSKICKLIFLCSFSKCELCHMIEVYLSCVSEGSFSAFYLSQSYFFQGCSSPQGDKVQANSDQAMVWNQLKARSFHKASEVVEHHYVNASDLNLLKANEAEASLTGRGAYTLMVGLTLIQTAAAKVACTLFSTLKTCFFGWRASYKIFDKKLADKIAASGYYVVVLDFFYSEPYDPQNTNRPLGEWLKDHRTNVWCGPGIEFTLDHASAYVDCVVARKNASSRRNLDAVERATHREETLHFYVHIIIVN